MSWWGPLAIIGGALLGLGIGLALVGGKQAAGVRRRSEGGVAYEQAPSTSELKLNPWPFFVIGGIIALIVGLAVGLSLN
jgi:uncharacterized protein YqhQ